MTTSSPVPGNDPQRVAQLHALQVLDTGPEPLYDALIAAAAAVAGAPIAVLGLIDADRLWFKASLGLDGLRQTPRHAAFGAHTIMRNALLEVPDALADPRFADNPLVAGAPGVRFYAGAPITLGDGMPVGSLGVMDRAPRRLDPSQRAVLTHLAHAAAEALQQRVAVNALSTALTREAEAERQLSRDRARLAHIIEATRAGTWDWNVQTGEIHLDERWAQIIGYRRSELEDLSADELFKRIHPHDLRISNELMRRHFNGELDAYDFEMRIRHRDGRWVWVHGHGRVVSRSDDGQARWMHGMHRDVNARKQAELALASSKAFLDRTGQVAGIGGWEVDLLTREVTWSDQTCRIHELPPGYRPTLEEAIGFYEEQSRTLIEAALRRSERDGSGWDLELSLLTVKGNRLWVRTTGTVEYDDEGVPIRLTGAIQDITLRKRATAAMETSERRFRKLFQYSLGLICTHDLNGIILSVNPAVSKSTGYAMADLMGRTMADFMRPALHPAFADYLRRIAANGTDSGLLELIAADGRSLIWQYHNIIDDDGDEHYVLAHAQDITERQRQERQLREWSIHDALTGCFNRRYLGEIEAAMHGTDAWGCIAVDLDRFKQVNDTYGHQRGDEVLVAMARFMSRHVRDGDVVIRVGGDEFVIMLKDADEDTTLHIMQRMRSDAGSAPIGFTLGHAVRTANMPLDALLARADKHLYESRAARRH